MRLSARCRKHALTLSLPPSRHSNYKERLTMPRYRNKLLVVMQLCSIVLATSLIAASSLLESVGAVTAPRISTASASKVSGAEPSSGPAAARGKTANAHLNALGNRATPQPSTGSAAARSKPANADLNAAGNRATPQPSGAGNSAKPSMKPMMMGTIHVTTTAQKIAGTGTGGCSLQEAIYSSIFHGNAAIASIAPDGTETIVTTDCEPGTGVDTIILPTGAVFTMDGIIDDAINLTGPAGTPMILSDVTIEANGSRLEHLGNLNFRAFAVSNGGNLTIKNAHIKGFQAKGGNGRGGGGGGLGAGGAIYVNVGGLTVESSTFEGNGATGGDGGSGVNAGGGGLGGNGGPGSTGGGGGGGGARGDGARGDGGIEGLGAGGGGGGTL